LISKSNKILFNIATIKICTETEGPFRRFAIWFQGCDIGCTGCCNPECNPLIKMNLMNIDELMAVIEESKTENGIEGVTFLGGEPTLQSNLPELAKRIHQTGLGCILFTGHLIETLDRSIIENIDLIVDGKFDYKQLDTSRNMIGSKNQRIHDITGRYAKCINWFLSKRNYQIEICVNDGLIQFNGDVL